jgi:hypothetical protein
LAKEEGAVDRGSIRERRDKGSKNKYLHLAKAGFGICVFVNSQGSRERTRWGALHLEDG